MISLKNISKIYDLGDVKVNALTDVMVTHDSDQVNRAKRKILIKDGSLHTDEISND